MLWLEIDPRVIIQAIFIGLPIYVALVFDFLAVCAHVGVERHRVLCETVIASADPVLYFREV